MTIPQIPNIVINWLTFDFMKEDGVLSLKKVGYVTGLVMSSFWLTKSLAALGWKPDAQWVTCFQWFVGGTVLAYVGGKVADKFGWNLSVSPNSTSPSDPKE